MANVYKNLRRGDWSVTDSDRVTRKGKVTNHVDAVLLTDCVFHVVESSRQIVLAKRERSVHAWIQGRVVSNYPINGEALRAISYNPYKSPFFYYRDNGAPIKSAKLVYFTETDGAFALE